MFAVKLATTTSPPSLHFVWSVSVTNGGQRQRVGTCEKTQIATCSFN